MKLSKPPRLGLVGGLCVALGACNGVASTSSSILEDSVPARGADMQALAPRGALPADAIASLPEEAGVVASVRGHAYVDGFRQDVLFKGDPVRGVENGMTILARTSRQSTLDERVPLFRPTEAAVRAEIGRAFPHLALQVVERPASNVYGPYGLAIGRGAGTVRCIYMWQWIDEGNAGPDIAGPASIRVRLCRPDTTFDALAAMMDHLSLHGEGGAQGLVVVDPPHAGPPARKTVAKRHVRPPRPLAEAQADPQPSEGAAPSLPAPVSLAGNLPPQAYLGPKSLATPVAPIR